MTRVSMIAVLVAGCATQQQLPSHHASSSGASASASCHEACDGDGECTLRCQGPEAESGRTPQDPSTAYRVAATTLGVMGVAAVAYFAMAPMITGANP